MMEYLYWGFWTIMFAGIILGCWRLATHPDVPAPFLAFFMCVGGLGVTSVIAYGIWVEVTDDSPTFALKKREWGCSSYETHYTAPTYVRSGSVMTPIGGGETKTCIQYTKVSQ